MSGIFKAPSDGYVDVPLLSGEQVLRRQTAAYLKGGKSIWGGQLIVTNQRILFRPLDVGAAASMIKDGIDFLPGNLADLGKVVSKTLDYTTAYGERLAGAVGIAEIVSASRGQNASLTKPASLVLRFADGRALEIGVLKGKGYPTFWPANHTVRDEVVSLISHQLAATR